MTECLNVLVLECLINGTHNSHIVSFFHSCILAFLHCFIPAFPHCLILPFLHSCILAFSHSSILALPHSYILAFSHSSIALFLHSRIPAFKHLSISNYPAPADSSPTRNIYLSSSPILCGFLVLLFFHFLRLLFDLHSLLC